MRTFSFQHFILFFLCILLIRCGSVNFHEYGAPSLNTKNYQNTAAMPEGGGCWAKCLIEPTYSNSFQEIIEYTGSNYNDPTVQELEIETKPQSTSWVKKKADPNCLSNNPEDCLVWCLIEESPIVEKFYIVKDTVINDSFRITNVPINVQEDQGGYTEWKEVVCAADQDLQFYSDLQQNLIRLGYEIEDLTPGVFDKSSKDALVKFQKDNQLSIGNLDLETLELLRLRH